MNADPSVEDRKAAASMGFPGGAEMFQFLTISTAGLELNRKLQFWNDVTSDTLTDQVVIPLDVRSFSGRLRRLDLGTVRLAEIVI